MSQQLPVRLRVLVPAVENSIAGDAFRPGDVIIARNGKSSEIGNTGKASKCGPRYNSQAGAPYPVYHAEFVHVAGTMWSEFIYFISVPHQELAAAHTYALYDCSWMETCTSTHCVFGRSGTSIDRYTVRFSLCWRLKAYSGVR